MAILIAGRTECPLCSAVLHADDDAVAFPPIFLNRLDSTFEVSDAAVHRDCLLTRPYAQRALAKLEDYLRRTDRAKVCAICARPLDDPADYFALGPLSDRPDEPIARYDWFESHLHCLPAWAGRVDLLGALRETERSGKWGGDVLDRLIRRIETVVAR